MASKEHGSTADSKQSKKEIKKRSWSSAEEEVLLDGLKGLVATGWKSDNGFKGGYMNLLEDAMKKAFPQTDLRGKPHIESKLTTWKRTYSTLRDILARSGVGFNLNGDNKIDCDDVLWEEIGRSIHGIQNWCNKKWPHFDSWKIVFGKDRATGEGGAEFMEMINNVIQDKEVPPPEGYGRENNPINLDENKPLKPPPAEDSVGQSTFSTAKAQKSSKKRQFEESISSLVDLVGDIQQTNVAKFEVFNSAFGRQGQVNKGRGCMWPLLRKIPGLTMGEMFEVGEKLLKMPECLELFLELEEDARGPYVERIRNM